MPKPITLTLSPEEAQNLADCLDIATKAGGLQVARATLPLMNKLMEAVQESKQEEPTTEA